MKKYLYLMILMCSVNVSAFMLDSTIGTFSDSLSTSSDSKSSRTFASVGLLGDLSRSDNARLNFGWYIISASSKTEMGSSSSETFKSLDMGPCLRWTIDPKKLFSLTFVYAIYDKGSYESGSTSQDITGTGTYVKFSVEPEINDKVNLGIALNYYSAQYAKAVTNSTESDISYKSSWIFPSLSVAIRF